MYCPLHSSYPAQVLGLKLHKSQASDPSQGVVVQRDLAAALVLGTSRRFAATGATSDRGNCTGLGSSSNRKTKREEKPPELWSFLSYNR